MKYNVLVGKTVVFTVKNKVRKILVNSISDANGERFVVRGRNLNNHGSYEMHTMDKNMMECLLMRM